MTRAEFIDSINDWADLIDFCNDVNCYICEDIYSDGAMDDYINENLVDMAENRSWRDLRDELDGLPDNDYYYLHDDYGDWVGVDDRFDDYKEDVISWCDDNGAWDDDEEENEDDTEYYLPEEPAPSSDGDEEEEQVDQGASLFDLFAACASGVQVVATVNATTESEQPSLAKLFMQ